MSSAAPPPISLPVGPQLLALARRRSLRDFRFWACFAGVMFFAFLAFGPVAASVMSGRYSLFSLGVIVRFGILIVVLLCIFNYRAQAIAADLQRTLPITVCRGCLYDTAAVPTDRCPECGAMIANTMPGVMP